MRSYNCCLPKKNEVKKISSLSSLLRLVTEESRLRILCLLKNSRHCVCELMSHTKQSQSLISHHLIDLKTAGLVADSKKGRRVEYSLTGKGKKITKLLFNI